MNSVCTRHSLQIAKNAKAIYELNDMTIDLSLQIIEVLSEHADSKRGNNDTNRSGI